MSDVDLWFGLLKMESVMHASVALLLLCQMVPYLGVWEREDGIGKGPSDTPILPVLWRMNIELPGDVLKD